MSNVPSKKDDSESPSKKSGAKEKRDKQNKNMLVISGGEGYIDFRLGELVLIVFVYIAMHLMLVAKRICQ